ncbi:MAG: hypothetical protein G01um101425_664 [Candidatus Peregrinibacteria bacterium Gr01-1014_25]|nr:MAG: hypothetical protein G01um101425_664 [Candidatus Peregrinibacteria bacterium Gr01-1014_25]
MHVRFSRCLGMPVGEERERRALGALSGIVIHPDTGVVEGFFVRPVHGGGAQFLPVADIVHWGARVTVRSEDALCSLSDIVRLQRLVESGRTIIGQRMVTDDGALLGRCRDVQFSTHLFQVQWLYPKRWLRWKTPVAITDVIEVRPEAVLVRSRSGVIPVQETLAPQPA